MSQCVVRSSDVRYSDKSATGGMINNENWSEIVRHSHGRKAMCSHRGCLMKTLLRWGRLARRSRYLSPNTLGEHPPLRRAQGDVHRPRVNVSSARATSRFPLPRCASTIQINRPSESTAETQPKLQPALGIVDHLRGRFARFKLGAHLL